MKAVFIDESKSKAYVLCAIFVNVEEVPRIRRDLNRLKLKGQSRIHFVSESNRRRRQILSVYRSLPIEVRFFVTRSESEARGREKCLRELVKALPFGDYCELWIEADSNHLELDKAVLTNALNAENKSSNVIFTHSDARTQILLWIPDALAWVRTRGSDWHKEFRGFDIWSDRPRQS
jgi:hypothetical protein